MLALSVTVSVPVRVPDAVGVNVTLIVQLLFCVTELPQVFVCAKSPLAAMFVIVTALPVKLLSVTVCAALVVFRVCPLNVRLLGFRDTLASLKERVSSAKSLQTPSRSVQPVKLKTIKVIFAADWSLTPIYSGSPFESLLRVNEPSKFAPLKASI